MGTAPPLRRTLLSIAAAAAVIGLSVSGVGAATADGSPVSGQASTTRQETARSLAVQPRAATQPAGVQGMDVSGWQSLTLSDWQTAYANGARFAYIKATESTDYVSSEFSEQYNDSYAVGMIRGAYHFATPNTSSGAAQANYFVSNGGGWSADGRTLPPMLDIEYNPYGDTCYGMAGAPMVAWIRDFSNTVYARTGRLPTIYSTTDWWTRCTGNSAAFSANPLFIARYTTSGSAGTLPAGWSNYTFWQWADSGIYPGDQDVFNGTLAQLTSLALSGSPRLNDPVLGIGDLDGDGKPDLLARRPDGSLWFYAGTGVGGGLMNPRQLGTGWDQFNDLIAAGDLNGDGIPDLLARKPDGTLWFFAGTHTGSLFNAGVQIGSGWGIYDRILGAGDMNGNGHPDLIARRPDGSLWFYGGTGGTASLSQSGLTNAVQIGSGWDVYQNLAAGTDLNGDGKPDIVGTRSDGSLWFYAGLGTTTGPTSTGLSNGTSVATGFADFTSLIAPGDMSGDGRPDLVGLKGDGSLWLFGGLGTTGNLVAALDNGVQIGTGWTAYSTLLGAGDLNGDGKPDLLGIRSDGSLWYYAGLGTTSGAGNTGLANGVQIGTGWDVYTKLIAAGDLNGDGKPDLLGIRPDGSLWYYAGLGTTSGAGNTGLANGVQIGTGWNVYTKLIAAGDLNGDGKPDLLGIRPDGSLWYYAGLGTTSGAGNTGLANGVQVGTGWDAYSTLFGPGDLNGDGKPDLLGVRSDGSLWYYAGLGTTSGAGNTGLANGAQIGTGWTVYNTLLGGGDLNGDGKPDLLGVRSDGSLWYYAGRAPAPTSGLLSPVQIGSGWNIYG